MNKVSLFFLLLLGPISVANADSPFAGPYLGLQGGYVNGDDDGNEYDEQVISSYSQDSDLSGGLFGLFAGYNYLLNNNFMVGLEADFDGRFGTDEDTFQKFSGVIDTQYPYRAESNIATSIRARLGYLCNDKTLLFVTGGYAGIEIEREWFTTGESESSLNTSWHHGWTAGVGLERVILNNIAMKVEYRYSSYGLETAASQIIYGDGTIERQDYDEHTLRVGISYLFSNPDSRHAAAGDFDLSGYYFGVTAGGLWGESDFDLYDWEGDNDGKFDDSDTALVGGVQLGYRNFLSNGFMWGLEADYQRSNYETIIRHLPENSFEYFGQEITDIITARIKAGKLVTANTLAYITGGYAFTLGDVTLHDDDDPPHIKDTDNIISHGWTVGAGIEHSINNNLSVKAEYLYLSTQGVANTYYFDEGEYYFSDTTFTANIFRLGLNYYF